MKVNLSLFDVCVQDLFVPVERVGRKPGSHDDKVAGREHVCFDVIAMLVSFISSSPHRVGAHAEGHG